MDALEQDVRRGWRAPGRIPGMAVLVALNLLSPAAGMAQADRAAADRPAIPLGTWDDDWWYPEGWIRLGRTRYSLFAGATLTRFASGASSASFGGGKIAPNIELFRPEHRGFSPALGVTVVSMASAGTSAGFIAPTVGARYQVMESDRSHWLVPYVELGAGPYFGRTSLAGRATVPGANASVGIQVLRSLRLSARYDFVPRGRGHDLSTIALGLSVRVPPLVSRRARSRMADDVPPPGVMVDVGGHRLHLVCAGTGEPAVVFEAGLADSWVVWERVLTGLAPTTRVCAYDRAGVAWSDPGPLPRTGGQIAAELHLLLERAGVAPPYILVGHSLGGLAVRLYAAAWPADVAGMVLVDATHEDLLSGSSGAVRAGEADDLARYGRSAAAAERAGRVSPMVPNLPIAVASRPAWYRARADELGAAAETAEQLRRANRALGMPLTVITAARRESRGGTPRAERARMGAVWDSLQADLALRSPQGRRVIAARSGHYVQRDEPRLVIEEVRRIVEDVRAAAQGSLSARN